MSNKVLAHSLALLSIAVAQVSYIPIDRSANELIQPQGPGAINWTRQIITAKGWGIIDPALPQPQARLLAIRAATVVAQRNLLEIIKGVNVHSQTAVADFMAKSDIITTEIDGIVKGAQPVGQPIEKDGVIEVEMLVALYGPGSIAVPIRKELSLPKKTPATKIQFYDYPPIGETDQQALKKYTALAIDAAGTGVQPALFPRIEDEEGNLLFDAAAILDPGDANFGKWLRLLPALPDSLKRLELGNNPYVVKAIKAAGSTLIVAKQEAEKITWLRKVLEAAAKVGKYLRYML